MAAHNCESQAWRGFRAGAAPCGSNGATLPRAGYLRENADMLDPVLVDQRLEGGVVHDDQGRGVRGSDLIGRHADAE